ncbi:hypothetical protein RH915_04570 [Serpentinicella sp. ANB-PHB4]|uniref:phenylacetate--CoA ligase family protein n=1 Tax=Serpentinicella sp. ANB-PHB4 TaxID=3074076 RepID=UPI0028674BD5|nr:hypothetical protein [Serpentinicella sp. ANB-PHB4]MDR5658757.1 hypothetical protein [Serpentinicella sp. ANB-PHB4]
MDLETRVGSEVYRCMKKTAFKLFQVFNNRGLLKIYKQLQNNLDKSYESLLAEQNSKLSKIIEYSFENVPYYNDIMKNRQIDPKCINSIKELKTLPIINKDIIKNNIKQFYSNEIIEYVNGATGGTTGSSLSYRMSRDDYLLSKAILYRGWGYGGYNLGDTVVTIAGSSLVPNNNNGFKNRVLEILQSNYQLSSYNITEETLSEYVMKINAEKPKFIRGYASSLNELSKFIIKNNIKTIRPMAVFSTAEMLTNEYRVLIERAFSTKVYDQYGLNDGGVTAFECEEHSGYHIDMERSILEVVDDYGNPVKEGEPGRIIATSLTNYAMPFIRYETGDVGIMASGVCKCGLPFRRLEKIIGRTDDMIKTRQGKRIHSSFLRKIIRSYDYIDKFQAVQNDYYTLSVSIVVKEFYKRENYLIYEKEIHDEITDYFTKNSIDLKVKIDVVDSIELSDSGKQRFFISNLEEQ